MSRKSTPTVEMSEYSLVQKKNLVSFKIGKLMPSARHTAAPMMARLNRNRRPPKRMALAQSRKTRTDAAR